MTHSSTTAYHHHHVAIINYLSSFIRQRQQPPIQRIYRAAQIVSKLYVTAGEMTQYLDSRLWWRHHDRYIRYKTTQLDRYYDEEQATQQTQLGRPPYVTPHPWSTEYSREPKHLTYHYILGLTTTSAGCREPRTCPEWGVCISGHRWHAIRTTWWTRVTGVWIQSRTWLEQWRQWVNVWKYLCWEIVINKLFWFCNDLISWWCDAASGLWRLSCGCVLESSFHS